MRGLRRRREPWLRLDDRRRPRRLRAERGRASTLAEATRHAAPCSSSARSMTPRWLPQKPGMQAGSPASAPLTASTRGSPRSRPPAAASADGQGTSHRSRRLRRAPSAAFSSPAAAGFARNAGVAEGEDEIDACARKSGKCAARGLDDVDRRHAALQVALVPLRDLRRGEADDADPQAPPAPSSSRKMAQNDPGLEIGPPVRLQQIAAQRGKVGSCERGVEKIQSIVELVIADRAGGVTSTFIAAIIGWRSPASAASPWRRNRRAACPG